MSRPMKDPVNALRTEGTNRHTRPGVGSGSENAHLRRDPQVLKTQRRALHRLFPLAAVWSPDYCLGLLHKQNQKNVPQSRTAWVKTRAGFLERDRGRVWGGWALLPSSSPSATPRDWIIYHPQIQPGKAGREGPATSAPKRFTWTSDGFPDFRRSLATHRSPGPALKYFPRPRTLACPAHHTTFHTFSQMPEPRFSNRFESLDSIASATTLVTSLPVPESLFQIIAKSSYSPFFDSWGFPLCYPARNRTQPWRRMDGRQAYH